MLTHSCGVRTFAASIYIHAPIPIAATLEQLLRHSKSIGPSAPIAYATSVSPPNKAVAWPGAGVECRMRLPLGLGEVPANHRAHESLFYAPLGHIGVRGGFNLSSSSTCLKVNHLCIRYLCFESMRGDLQERPLLCFPSTKTPFLCQNDQRSRKNRPF